MYKIKILFYGVQIFIFNNTKKNKNYTHYNKKLNFIKKYKYNIYGHKSLACSIFRGFKNLNIDFTYNKIQAKTKYVIVLWCDRTDIKRLKKLKTRFKFKLATAPTACKFDYDYQYELAKDDTVDFCLVGSPWVKNLFLEKIGPTYANKIFPWPSGVELPVKPDKKIKSKCLVYYKKEDVNDNLVKILNEHNIAYKNYIYGQYQIENWKDDLKKVDFVIFYTNIIETQGLALAECWANDVPTIVKYNENEFGGTTAPYLTDKNGLFYKDMDELRSILERYRQSPTSFIWSFSPREYVEQNMSDSASVRKLISIVSGDGE